MNSSLLKKTLDNLCKTYNGDYLFSDPIKFVHQYKEPLEREVVGLICTSLAYGKVKMIQRNLDRLLKLLGPAPTQYVLDLDPARAIQDLSGFSHRFTRGNDIVLLLCFVKQMLSSHGSIGDFYKAGYRQSDPDIRNSLENFVERVLNLDCSPIYSDGVLPKNAGVRFFFPSPASHSACKRLNLYLRWMVRCGDEIDFGLWQFIRTDQLIIPLDTHIARICSMLGLTSLRTPGWNMAAEITGNLRRLDPADPVKYDFALSRLGILAECPARPMAEKCSRCQMRRLCRVHLKGHSKPAPSRGGHLAKRFAQIHT